MSKSFFFIYIFFILFIFVKIHDNNVKEGV